MSYSGRSVLITGGLGFIGSNLALRLVELGAHVTVVDACLPGCGADLANIAEMMFNLAGEIRHVHSTQLPERDLQINTVAQLRFLLACKEVAPRARIVYAGTRQVYGTPKYLPVDEAHPVQPIRIFGDGKQLRNPVCVDDAVEAFLPLGDVPHRLEYVPTRTSSL